MSTALKCPNPSCPYLFDPSRVPAGAVLTCPRCGMRFTLGPPVPAAPAASPPQAQFDSPPPPPTGFEGIDPNAPDPDGQPIRRSLSAAGEAGSYQTGIIAFMCFVLIAGAAVAVYFKVTSQPEVVKGENGQQLRAHNLSFEAPGEPWVIDDDTRAKLGPPMILGFKRTGPDAYFCVGARDFDRREPRPSELRTAGYKIVDAQFPENEKEQLEGMTLLGQPATVAFRFRGTNKDGVKAEGLCFATHSKGVGYWTLSWASERDAESQAAAFEGIRAKLKLNNSRDNWTPKELPVRTFGGHAVQYQLLDSDDLWTEPDAKTRSPAEEDPKGDLLLIAKAKVPGKDVAEEATLVTILLDGAGDDALCRVASTSKTRCGPTSRKPTRSSSRGSSNAAARRTATRLPTPWTRRRPWCGCR